MMNITHIKEGNTIRPLKYSVADTPHIVIEPNLTCDIRCRTCYNLYPDYVKPFDLIIEEINTALEKRRLDTISIVGGEPTLHPQLVEIVSYIKSKGVICQLLTNGIVLQDDREDVLLRKLIAARLDRLILHVDVGQDHVHSDIHQFCVSIIAKCERYRINVSLSITIYLDNRGAIPELIRKYAPYRYFDGILALLARDPIQTVQQEYAGKSKPELLEEYESIRSQLGVRPAAYIPSSLDDAHISWLMYFYYYNASTGRTMDISPRLNRLFRRLYHLIRRRHIFGMTTKPPLSFFYFILTGLIEILLNPRRVPEILRIIRRSNWLRQIRFHYIVIQSGPEYNYQSDTVEMCYHCPDATIRNGKLTPVCVADQINPLQDNAPVANELGRMVYHHLEDA